jgi:hypothetical protein
MWKRSTWHECADELESVCERFRLAFWGKRSQGWPRHPGDIAEMEETSKQGVQLLRALALAVRSEQDFDLAPTVPVVVGALKKEDGKPSDVYEAKKAGGYEGLLKGNGYIPLNLRQSLNKIAHTDPRTADFYVGPWMAHDLLLFGENRGKNWFAAISIIELVRAIRSLPDATVVASEADRS